MNKPILMYHDVYRTSLKESGFQSDGANYYKIPESSFQEQILQMKEFPVVFTFDDGGVSFYNIIAPLLEKHSIYGHFFIATDRKGSEGFMTEEQIKDLHQRGHHIGSHSCSHPSDFRELSFSARTKEWYNSVLRLSKIIDEPVKEVSIPNGFLQEDDFLIFESLGISVVYTSKLGENRQCRDIRVLGRIGIDSSLPIHRIESLVSGGGAYKIMLMKQWILSIFKVVFGKQYIKIKAGIRKIYH